MVYCYPATLALYLGQALVNSAYYPACFYHTVGWDFLLFCALHAFLSNLQVYQKRNKHNRPAQAVQHTFCKHLFAHFGGKAQMHRLFVDSHQAQCHTMPMFQRYNLQRQAQNDFDPYLQYAI